MNPTRVTASTTSTDAQIITRAVETLAWASAGLALEGVEIIISIGPDYPDEVDEPQENET